MGAAGALSLCIADAVWPGGVAVALSMLFTVVLTGAFHEDGLADVADGTRIRIDDGVVYSVKSEDEIAGGREVDSATLLALAKRLGNGSVAALPMRACLVGYADSTRATRRSAFGT